MKSAVCAAILLVAGSVAASAEGAYGVDFWRDAEGLSQSRIRAIAQTRDGYIWLGTDGGLVRFNGESFHAYTADTGDLKDSEVWALREDDEGALWIGTYGGGLTVLKDGHFRSFSVADGLPDDVVMALDKDAAGNIWMVTPQGLGRYSHGVFRRFGVGDGLFDAHVGGVCGSSPEGVLAATRAGIYRFVNNRFEPVASMQTKTHGAADHILCGSDGSVWVGYASGTIGRWKQGVFENYESAENRGRQIHKLYEDTRGGVWAAIGRQLTKFDGGGFAAVPLEAGPGGLGSVYSLCMDREGSVWVGLQSNGIARLRPRQLSTLSVENGLPDDRARAVFQDSHANIWIGTADGLARYNDGKISAWTGFEGMRLGDVRSIAEDSGGNLWLSAGRDVLTLKQGQLKRLEGWVGRFEVEVLYRDPRGVMWIGTDGAGLYRYANGIFTNYQAKDGLGSNYIRAILADRNGNLWISAFGSGVSKYSNGVFTTIATKDGLAGDRIVAMHQDEEGAMWFATRRGLTRLKNGTAFTWTASSGMTTSFVYTILDDGQGSFWFSSAQGIFRVRKADLRAFAAGTLHRIVPVAYGVQDGMRTRAGNLGNQPAAWKTDKGQLLFSSMKGVVMVDPARIAPSTFTPPVYIESATVNRIDRPVDRRAELPRGTGEVEIHYAALSYFAPEKLRYKYMLEGIDRDWIEAGGRRFTYYANLPSGDYVFRVIAGSTDGAWNAAGAAFAFRLSPPFYQTGPFRALAISGGLFLAWLLYQLRMHGLKVRYSAVLAERNRISRDLHDTLAQNLAGIALQLDAVHMELPAVKDNVSARLDQACNLTRYSLAEARRAIADLRGDELSPQALSDALPELVRTAAQQGVLESRLRISGAPRKLHPVTEKNLLRIFQEALANTVKHARAHSVDVELRYAADGIAIRVYDDGCGFDTEKTIPLGAGHFGLLGMRERAERIGGHLTLTSKPGEGTELRVELPL